ncbi:hypothetical protein FRB99_003296, partial [Tulasnella sp. 403]
MPSTKLKDASSIDVMETIGSFGGVELSGSLLQVDTDAFEVTLKWSIVGHDLFTVPVEDEPRYLNRSIDIYFDGQGVKEYRPAIFYDINDPGSPGVINPIGNQFTTKHTLDTLANEIYKATYTTGFVVQITDTLTNASLPSRVA